MSENAKFHITISTILNENKKILIFFEEDKYLLSIV